MYERYETTYFCKLWRSVEASNLIALDFNGDFVLYVHRSRVPACCCCCMSHLSGAVCSSFVCLDKVGAGLPAGCKVCRHLMLASNEFGFRRRGWPR